jgi:alcohol dehydrogenase class IV
MTRDRFNFLMPTKIVFGIGIISEASKSCKELGIKKPLLVTDPFLSETDAFKDILKNLSKNNLDPKVWEHVIPDPTDVSISDGAVAYQAKDCDGLIAFGGGSSMDSAKAIGVLVYHGETEINMFIGANAEPLKGIPPLLCVPTTAGTGSEVTKVSVITNTSMARKTAILNPILYPKIAIVDPNLTITMPSQLTAATGMDALSHAIESYTSTSRRNPLSDALALDAIKLISENLRGAVYDGTQMMNRMNMSLASLMAGIAFDNTGVHLGHAFGHMLGAKYHVSHGVGCALLLPEILEIILPTRLERLAKMATSFGIKARSMSKREAAEKTIHAVSQLMDDIKLPSLAKVTKTSVKDVELLADLLVQENRLVSLSPRRITRKDSVQMFKKAFSRKN